jgi:hypothetical protein
MLNNLFRSVTPVILPHHTNTIGMDSFHLRMQLAALRQLLRDRQEHMTQEQIDQILDLIVKIQKELEKD